MTLIPPSSAQVNKRLIGFFGLAMAGTSGVSLFAGWFSPKGNAFVGFAILWFWLVPLILGFCTFSHYRARKHTGEKRKFTWTDATIYFLFVAFLSVRYIWNINPLEPFYPLIYQHGKILLLLISMLPPCLLAYTAWKWIASPDTIETIDEK